MLTTSVNSRWPSTWWQHCSQTVNRNNFVIFRLRSKRIAILESVFFLLRVSICKFSIFVVVMWPILGTIQGLYLPNAWSQTLQTGKRHTFRVSALHQYHWFGVKLFLVGCVQDLKHEKCCFLDLAPAPPMLQNSRIFYDSTRPHLHFDSLPLKSWRSVVSI